MQQPEIDAAAEVGARVDRQERAGVDLNLQSAVERRARQQFEETVRRRVRAVGLILHGEGFVANGRQPLKGVVVAELDEARAVDVQSELVVGIAGDGALIADAFPEGDEAVVEGQRRRALHEQILAEAHAGIDADAALHGVVDEGVVLAELCCARTTIPRASAG